MMFMGYAAMMFVTLIIGGIAWPIIVLITIKNLRIEATNKEKWIVSLIPWFSLFLSFFPFIGALGFILMYITFILLIILVPININTSVKFK